jgi:hypothetical protein
MKFLHKTHSAVESNINILEDHKDDIDAFKKVGDKTSGK